MCKYAKFNGYDGTGFSAARKSNSVAWTFPSGYPTSPTMQLTVTENEPAYFSSLVTGSNLIKTGATAVCGVQGIYAPPPLVVLHPTALDALSVSGTAQITIVGGPIRSVEVNSNNQSAAVSIGTVDLSQAGPNWSGGDFGLFGAPTQAPSGFNGGTTGAWVPHALPVSDPYQNLPPPATSSQVVGTYKNVNYGVDGCPDHNGCVEYFPGTYSAAICSKNEVVIFYPGVYIIAPTSFHKCFDGSSLPGTAGNLDFYVGANGIIRNAIPTSGFDQRQGVMFYLGGTTGAGYGGVNFDANAGKTNDIVDAVATTYLTCNGGAPDSHLNIPSTLTGNILWGMCTTHGTYSESSGYSDPLDSNGIRGLIFFQSHDAYGLQPNFGGGGGYAYSGSFYVHASDYSSSMTMQGNSGSNTYVLGEIVTDTLSIGGTANLTMALSTKASSSLNKVVLVK
jgi:hypothetical protein